MEYSSGSHRKILNCFSKNNIKLTFEKSLDLKNTLNQIIKFSSSVHLQENKKNLFKYEVVEYNLTKSHPCNLKKMYSYGWTEILAHNKNRKHLQSIQDLLSFTGSSLFDISECFSDIFKYSNNVIHSFEYRISPKNLLGVDDSNFKYLIDTLKMPSVVEEIRNNNNSIFDLLSIHFNYQNQIIDVSFLTSLKNLKSDIISDYFLHYKNFIDIFNIIDDDGEVSITFFPNSKKFSLEIFPTKEETFSLLFHKLQYLNIYDSNFLDELSVDNYKNFSIKFSWINYQTMEVILSKIYLNKNWNAGA